jgi:hypothetical protein
MAKKKVMPPVVPANVGSDIALPLADEKAVQDNSKKPVKNEELDKLMEPYLKAYPKEKCFYLTSDGQVFLSANKAFANDHQKFLNKNKEVVEYLV